MIEEIEKKTLIVSYLVTDNDQNSFISNIKKILELSKSKIVIKIFSDIIDLNKLKSFQNKILSVIDSKNIEVISLIFKSNSIEEINSSDIVLLQLLSNETTIITNFLNLNPPFVILAKNSEKEVAINLLNNLGFDNFIAERNNQFIIKAVKLIDNKSFRDNFHYIKSNMDLYLNLYKLKENIILSSEFFQTIKYFVGKVKVFDENELYKLNKFLSSFFKIFTKEDFVIPTAFQVKFIDFSSFLADIIHLSEFKTSDKYLDVLANFDYTIKNSYSLNNFIKLLTLYSVRNKCLINYDNLFKFDQKISSRWYWNYFNINNISSEISYNNIQRHIEEFSNIEKYLICDDFKYSAYYFSSYCHHENDRFIKTKINKFFKTLFVNLKQIEENNLHNEIAIITRYFYPRHSVYRSFFPFIKALSEDFKLTLIHPGKWISDTDTSLFKNIIRLEKISPVEIKDVFDKFQLVFFTDIGMSDESTFLSNLRFSPIQVAGYGHSVSTFGSDIDYFIGGFESEIIEKVENNYSERLVLIPGIGLCPTLPDYRLQGIINKTDTFIISCPWTIQKFNYPHLLNLKKILELSDKKLCFRFFPGLFEDSSLKSFEEDLSKILGRENIEIFKNTKFDEYMKLMEGSDLILESFHYGGYTTIIESLYLRKPIITFEGSKANNRFGSAILKKLDLSELISTNNQEYIHKSLKIIHDDNYRNFIREKIIKVDLNKTLFNTNEPEYFKKAIHYLLENHKALKGQNSKEPIIIS